MRVIFNLKENFMFHSENEPPSHLKGSLLDPQYPQQRASEKCYPQHCNWTFGIITVFPLVFQYPAQT